MTMITIEELLNLGFEEFAWNGGIIMEYWKSIDPGKNYPWEYRIAVRYNEYHNKPCIVWLVTGSTMTQMVHVTTIAQIVLLYELFTGIRLDTGTPLPC